MKQHPSILYALFLLSQTMTAQSGWTRQADGLFAKVGAYTLSSDKYFDSAGREVGGARTFSQQAFLLYGEYGIAKNITGILNFPFYKFQGYENFSTAHGWGDPQLEIKFAVLKKIPVVSASIGVEIPIAEQNNFSVEKTETMLGVRNSIRLPSGDSDFNYWGTLAVSTGFGNTPGWFTVWGQYNVRTKGFSNQKKLGFELGYKWTTKFWTNARLVGQYQGRQKNSGNTATIINGQDTEFTSINIGASYELVKHWNLTFDWQTYNDILIKRKNLYAAPLYMLGVSAEF